MSLDVLLVSSSSGSHGGGEFYLLNLASGLSHLGHRVRLAMSDSDQMDVMAERCVERQIEFIRIPYHNTYRRKLRSLAAYFDYPHQKQLTKILSDFAPDVIHLNHQCIEDGLDLLPAAKQTGIPTVATIHVVRSAQELKALGGYFRDKLAKHQLDRCAIPAIAISNQCAIDLRSFLGVSVDTKADDQKVYCVPNGVPNVPNAARDEFKKEWGLPQDAVVLGCVARIEEQKNPLFAVKLMATLPEHVHLVWVGDGRLRSEMESAIQTAGLGHRIHLTGWKENAAACLNGFDVFVLPSRYEGLPLALLEAMSAGLPSVVSDVDGNREPIQDGVTGKLCPVDDLQYWSAAVQFFVESQSHRQAIGNSARLKFIESYSVQAMSEATADVYRTIKDTDIHQRKT